MRILCWFLGLSSILQPINSAWAHTMEYPALLGNGYDALKLEHKVNRCMTGKILEIPAIQVATEFNKVEDWGQFQVQMDFGVPGSLVLNSDSELAKFVIRARDTKLTSTYVLHHHVRVKKKMLTDSSLAASAEKESRAFREECGTQYVSLIDTGGELYVGARFSFEESRFKQEFDAGGSMKSLTGLGVHVNSLSDRAKKNSSVEIFFHQTGGNLSDLNNMFESKDIVSCSLEKFDRCESLLEAILNYSKGSFSKAVMDEGKDQTIGFQTQDYLYAQQIYEDPEVRKERMRILDMLDEQYLDHDLLTSLKGKLVEYEGCDERCLRSHIMRVIANMRLLKESVVLSFADPERFLALGRLAMLELHKVSFPTKKRKSYMDYFMKKILPVLPVTSAVACLSGLIGGLMRARAAFAANNAV